jgi:hypothetical protein
MPQSWILMLVGLGFVLALLASLVTTRLVWLYLARRKALGHRRRAPVAEAAHEAERDRLRAENAVLQQKLIKTEKNLKEQLAEHMAQTARYRNRLDAAQTEITRLRLAQPLAPPLGAREPSASPAEDAAEARLRERLNHLTELANKIELQRTRPRRRSTDVDAEIDFGSAEAEAAALEGELKSRIQKQKRNPKG